MKGRQGDPSSLANSFGLQPLCTRFWPVEGPLSRKKAHASHNHHHSLQEQRVWCVLSGDHSLHTVAALSHPTHVRLLSFNPAVAQAEWYHTHTHSKYKGKSPILKQPPTRPLKLQVPWVLCLHPSRRSDALGEALPACLLWRPSAPPLRLAAARTFSDAEKGRQAPLAGKSGLDERGGKNHGQGKGDGPGWRLPAQNFGPARAIQEPSRCLVARHSKDSRTGGKPRLPWLPAPSGLRSQAHLPGRKPHCIPRRDLLPSKGVECLAFRRAPSQRRFSSNPAPCPVPFP